MTPPQSEADDANDPYIPGGDLAPPTRAHPIQRSAGRPLPTPVLASYYQRNEVIGRLKDAFGDSRLDDRQFDHRMRTALAARTHRELDALVADLPGTQEPNPGAARVGRFAVGLNGPVRRSGRWRVPGWHATVVYNGQGEVDLRVAELTSQVTTLLAVGWNATITVLVPPDVHVQVSGIGVDSALAESPAPPEAPVVNIWALTCKGTVELLPLPR
jgi:hypothetical protein